MDKSAQEQIRAKLRAKVAEWTAEETEHWFCGSTRNEVKWHTEFGHLNRGDMLTSEQHRCSNEKKKFQRRV
ncbi:hypothetical protein [Enterobacter kobei]|uniref:hypothetical protein n=1 Tax=Enterobacter kobei TaxID=208224 RepID=UPI0032AEBEFF